MTCSTQACLRLYKIVIEWTVSQSKDPSRPQSGVVAATLRAEALQVAHDCRPTPFIDPAQLDLQQSVLKTELSSLYVIQANPADPVESPFHILGLFTFVGDFFSPQGPQTSCSTVTRWEIGQEQPELLDVFKTLKAGNNKLGGLEVRQ